jgi:hypothetical protein
MRLLLVLKGAHEIASLSSFFCVKTKQNHYKNFSLSDNIAQHIKILSCLKTGTITKGARELLISQKIHHGDF